MWIITKDHLDDGAEGTCSRNFDKEQFETLKQEKFKIYDDDGELYYEGIFAYHKSDWETSGCPEGFEPLDDFATPNAGATEIHYDDGAGNFIQL